VPCTALKCRNKSHLRASVTHLRGLMVFVDNAAEYLPVLYKNVRQYGDQLVMIWWPRMPVGCQKYGPVL